ncbi:hypothetical protein D3C81_1789090 [compost metagenome]
MCKQSQTSQQQRQAELDHHEQRPLARLAPAQAVEQQPHLRVEAARPPGQPRTVQIVQQVREFLVLAALQTLQYLTTAQLLAETGNRQ